MPISLFPPVWLTLTPRVLGTSCCVLLLQVLCRTKKLIGGVKQAFSFGPSSRGSGSRSGDESQHFAWSSSFVPHRTRPGGRSTILHTMTFLWPQTTTTFPSVAPRRWRSTESLRQREFYQTCVYIVNLLERVGMDKELFLILRAIGWGKLYGGNLTTRAIDG
jgi:hypothetical protein